MKILVVNRGSSSIKCDLYVFDGVPAQFVPPLWTAHLQWKNDFEKVSLKVETSRGKTHEETFRGKDTGKALSQVLELLYQGEVAVLSSLKEIDRIGHRIVHGGRFFRESQRIDAQVKAKIASLVDLAPLHNPLELEAIEILEKLCPETPQIAVFDTAFHHTLTKAAAIYPGPYAWYEQGIQRYGFHGMSFQYCSKRAADLVKKPLEKLKMVICHLGSGASLCAIEGGKSRDTTMGFTPLEGLMMDTRCGSIDPGILLYLQEKKKQTPEEISHTLYFESGLLGVSESSSDMRDILEKREKGDSRAQLALDLYLHRLTTSIGAMITSIKGMDVLVFTAGIGENSAFIREKVCETLSFLGIKLDKKKNQSSSSEDLNLSATDAKIQVLLIHTKEAFEIAKECFQIIF